MSRIISNPFLRILRNDDPDAIPAGASFSERLAALGNPSNDGGDPPQGDGDPHPKPKAGDPDPDPDPDPNPFNLNPDDEDDGGGDPDPDADEEDDEVEEEEEEDDLPTLDKLGKVDTKAKEEPSDEFDEEAFDKETIKLFNAAGKKGKKPFDVFKEMRQELKEAKRALATKPVSAPPEVLSELESLRPLKQEVEVLRQRNEKLLQAGDRYLVEETQEYQDKVTTPIKEMEETVELMVEALDDISVDDVFAIINEKNVQKQDALIDAFTKKFGSRMGLRINAMADEMLKIRHIDKKLRENAPETLKAARARQAEAEAQEKERRTNLFRSAGQKHVETIAKHIPGFTNSSGSLTETAKATIAKVQTVDIDSLEPEDLAYTVAATYALPVLRKEVARLTKELSLLKGGKSTAVIPPAKTGKTGKRKASAANEGEKSFMDRFREQAKEGFSFNQITIPQ